MRIHVKKLDGQNVYGSLNIGELKATNIVHISGNPCFFMNDELVYCSLEMYQRINERLQCLK